MKNLDSATVKGFGQEWQSFSHSDINIETLRDQFRRYFSLVDLDTLKAARVLDVGCGSGRWAWFLAPYVEQLHCVDASAAALKVAQENLSANNNCRFYHASVDKLPVEDKSFDLVYSLGVLHHVPDTQAGINACADKLKPGGVLLVYLYYAFDNRPRWFRLLWQVSDALRKGISRLPYRLRYWLSQLIAVMVYWPLAMLARAVEASGRNVEHLPLSAYRKLPFYAMRTDALDRFGTRLEQRFSRQQIKDMLLTAGLENVRFRQDTPYWIAVAEKPQPTT